MITKAKTTASVDNTSLPFLVIHRSFIPANIKFPISNFSTATDSKLNLFAEMR